MELFFKQKPLSQQNHNPNKKDCHGMFIEWLALCDTSKNSTSQS